MFFSLFAKAVPRLYLHNCRETIKMPHVVFERLWFFRVFSKMMKFLRFYYHFCLSGDFLVSKRRCQRRLAHVHLEQCWLRFGHCLESRNAFFLYFCCNELSKKLSFHCLKSITGCLLFGDLFSNIFMEIQKCDFGAHPKYWKIQ